MSLILSIETATPVCSVAINREDELLSFRYSDQEKSHSELLAVLIRESLAEASAGMGDIQAVAVSEGPGSYTGLRIGTATAKGLSFATGKPLIAVNTLLAMAQKVKNESVMSLCPMIDARRMEVYCLITDKDLNVLKKTHAKVIDETSFTLYLDKGPVAFFGNGAQKCMEVISHHNAHFISGVQPSAEAIGKLAWEKFKNQQFEDLSAFEPLYLKEFMIKKPKTT